MKGNFVTVVIFGLRGGEISHFFPTTFLDLANDGSFGDVITSHLVYLSLLHLVDESLRARRIIQLDIVGLLVQNHFQHWQSIALLPRPSYQLCRLCGDFQRLSGAGDQLHGVHFHLAECLHPADVFVDVHADGESGGSQPFFLTRRIHNRLVNARHKVKGRTHRQVMHVEEVLRFSVDQYLVPLETDLRQSGILQSENRSQEESIDKVAVIIDEL